MALPCFWGRRYQARVPWQTNLFPGAHIMRRVIKLIGQAQWLKQTKKCMSLALITQQSFGLNQPVWHYNPRHDSCVPPSYTTASSKGTVGHCHWPATRPAQGCASTHHMGYLSSTARMFRTCLAHPTTQQVRSACGGSINTSRNTEYFCIDKPRWHPSDEQ